MSDKDYFGDDWVDDLADGEGSQIEYSDELLDESFGGDFEGGLVEDDTTVLGSNSDSKNSGLGAPVLGDSEEPILTQNEVEIESEKEAILDAKNEVENRLPQRPKIVISEQMAESNFAGVSLIKKPSIPAPAGTPITDIISSNSTVGSSGLSEAELAEEYFESEPEGKAIAGSALPIIVSLPTVPSTQTPKRPTREERVVPELDVLDILKAGADETTLLAGSLIEDAFGIDIDYDPNEQSLDVSDEGSVDLSLLTSEEDEDSEDGFGLEDDDEDSEEFDSEEFDDGEFDSEDDENLEGEGSEKGKKERVQRTPNSKRKRPGPKRRRGPKPGIRLTARDVYLLMFLARYRVATVAQLARMFGTSETALRNRLPKLEKEKLVSWAWGAQSKPKLWLISKKGLQVINMTLTVPTVKWGQLRHTLGLVDLGIEFELAGEVVITEREIRAAATRYTPTARIKTAVDFMYFVKELEEEDDEHGHIKRALTIPMANRSFGHIPDMILTRQSYPNGASGNIAIELELHRKQTNEWIAVLTAYRDTDLFELVQYYTMNKEIKRALTAIVKALGAEDKIQIHYFIPIDNTADPLITGGK